jgi:small basic protein (TIGR04137 family)
MSIHSSLRGVDTLTGERSVLTRIERIQKLRREGKFDAEKGSVYGLPKVRTKFKVVTAKKKKAAETEAKKAGEGEGEAKEE